MLGYKEIDVPIRVTRRAARDVEKAKQLIEKSGEKGQR